MSLCLTIDSLELNPPSRSVDATLLCCNEIRNWTRVNRLSRFHPLKRSLGTIEWCGVSSLDSEQTNEVAQYHQVLLTSQ